MLKLNVGKSYNIDYVIQKLENAPDIQLGHIVIIMTREHKYYVSIVQLKDIARKINKKIVEGGKEYEKVGKRFIPLADIIILSMIDPYEKYRKYDKFYVCIEQQIMKGIVHSNEGSIAAYTDTVINEAKNIIFIDNEKEFLRGLSIFFKRKGVMISYTEKNEYILFDKRVKS